MGFETTHFVFSLGVHTYTFIGNFVGLLTLYNIPKKYSFGIHGNQVQGRISVNLNIASKIAAITKQNPNMWMPTRRIKTRCGNSAVVICCGKATSFVFVEEKKKGHSGP